MMSIKDVLQDYALQCLEEQIILEFDPRTCREHPCLLSVRKDIINHYMLQRQEELLPDIVAFNDALREALRKMYNEAMAVYEANKVFGEYVSVEARCYLSSDYPTLHPVQTENRQELWNALQDSGWNLLYDDGITFPLRIDKNYNETFDDLTGMSSPPPNWNEGLDQELTKDLHLIAGFHHLFDHTEFAITDFIYVREFQSEIKVTIDKWQTQFAQGSNEN